MNYEQVNTIESVLNTNLGMTQNSESREVQIEPEMSLRRPDESLTQDTANHESQKENHHYQPDTQDDFRNDKLNEIIHQHDEILNSQEMIETDRFDSNYEEEDNKSMEIDMNDILMPLETIEEEETQHTNTNPISSSLQTNNLDIKTVKTNENYKISFPENNNQHNTNTNSLQETIPISHTQNTELELTPSNMTEQVVESTQNIKNETNLIGSQAEIVKIDKNSEEMIDNNVENSQNFLPQQETEDLPDNLQASNINSLETQQLIVATNMNENQKNLATNSNLNNLELSDRPLNNNTNDFNQHDANLDTHLELEPDLKTDPVMPGPSSSAGQQNTANRSPSPLQLDPSLQIEQELSSQQPAQTDNLTNPANNSNHQNSKSEAHQNNAFDADEEEEEHVTIKPKSLELQEDNDIQANPTYSTPNTTKTAEPNEQDAQIKVSSPNNIPEINESNNDNNKNQTLKDTTIDNPLTDSNQNPNSDKNDQNDNDSPAASTSKSKQEKDDKVTEVDVTDNVAVVPVT